MINKIKPAAIFFFLICFTAPIFSQEVDIIPYLKEVENGNKESAQKHLAQLEEKSPNDPSVKFLKGVLTENGQDAVTIFTDIVKNSPRSKYADASLYRLYSYYFALGSYDAAKSYLTRLKKDYPLSPYIKIADRKIPAADDSSVVKTNTKVVDKEEKETPKEYKYTIQAAAFSNSGNAAALKKDFEKSGFETQVKEKTVGGTVFQVVYVGKFETEDEAKSFLQVINTEFKLDGRVIELN